MNQPNLPGQTQGAVTQDPRVGPYCVKAERYGGQEFVTIFDGARRVVTLYPEQVIHLMTALGRAGVASTMFPLDVETALQLSPPTRRAVA
jgi:hypothetical protein